MRNHLMKQISLGLAIAATTQHSHSSEPIPVTSKFDADEIAWIKGKGNASLKGEAYIKLEDGTYKGCAGFNIELLPVADYSSERILKTYGNNSAGQILISENPPKFTPDAKAYHELVIKTKCDENNKFLFSNVPAGNYYVMAFIIWDGDKGGGVMKRTSLTDGKTKTVTVKAY